MISSQYFYTYPSKSYIYNCIYMYLLDFDVQCIYLIRKYSLVAPFCISKMSILRKLPGRNCYIALSRLLYISIGYIYLTVVGVVAIACHCHLMSYKEISFIRRHYMIIKKRKYRKKSTKCLCFSILHNYTRLQLLLTESCYLFILSQREHIKQLLSQYNNCN